MLLCHSYIPIANNFYWFQQQRQLFFTIKILGKNKHWYNRAWARLLGDHRSPKIDKLFKREGGSVEGGLISFKTDTLIYRYVQDKTTYFLPP